MGASSPGIAVAMGGIVPSRPGGVYCGSNCCQRPFIRLHHHREHAGVDIEPKGSGLAAERAGVSSTSAERRKAFAAAAASLRQR
jgi:hypothetical protein